MKKLHLVFALPMLFMACGGTGEPAADTVNAIEVVIVNGLGSWNIEEVMVDPSDGPWSENRLAEALKPGEDITIVLAAEDSYDIMITDEDGDTYTMWGVDIDKNDFRWEVTLDDLDGLSEDVTITVENGLGNWNVFYLYCSNSDDDSWGEDILGDEILAPNESLTFTVQSGEWYDFLAEDEDGDSYVLFDEFIDGDFTWVIDFDYMDMEEMPEGDAEVTIYNDLGDWSIWYVYCDPTSSDWTEDRLGSEVLHPGNEFTFYVPAGDSYDIKVEDEDGDSYTIWGVDIDESGYYWEVTLSDLD